MQCPRTSLVGPPSPGAVPAGHPDAMVHISRPAVSRRHWRCCLCLLAPSTEASLASSVESPTRPLAAAPSFFMGMTPSEVRSAVPDHRIASFFLCRPHSRAVQPEAHEMLPLKSTLASRSPVAEPASSPASVRRSRTSPRPSSASVSLSSSSSASQFVLHYRSPVNRCAAAGRGVLFACVGSTLVSPTVTPRTPGEILGSSGASGGPGSVISTVFG